MVIWLLYIKNKIGCKGCEKNKGSTQNGRF